MQKNPWNKRVIVTSIMMFAGLSLLSSAVLVEADEAGQNQGNNPYGRLDLYNYPPIRDYDAFLSFETVPDDVALLPPPPAEGTAAFAADVAAYEAGLALRKTLLGELALQDNDITAPDIGWHFASSFGMELSPQSAPVTFNLIYRTAATLGWYATIGARKHYQRPRPFVYFEERSCLSIEDEEELRPAGSYSSGHTAYGWGVALVLAEISPERQDAILKRGFEFGQSRVICGVHWQSDVDAARLVAAATVARLHADPAFMHQLAAAKHEIALLRAKIEAVSKN